MPAPPFAWSQRNILGPFGTIDEELLRDSILILAHTLVNHVPGQALELEGTQRHEALFEYVTEGRQGPGYSGCADLDHTLLWAIVVLMMPSLPPAAVAAIRKVVNRQEAFGWVSQVNINRLYASKHFRHLKPGQPWLVKPADMPLIGENLKAHVFCLESYDPSSGTLSNDYGQWWARTPSVPALDGGIQRKRSVGPLVGGRMTLGKSPDARPIIGHFDVKAWLQEVIDAAGSDLEQWLVRVPEGWENSLH